MTEPSPVRDDKPDRGPGPSGIVERTAIVRDPSGPAAFVRMMVDRRDLAGARESAARVAADHGWEGAPGRVTFVPTAAAAAYAEENDVTVALEARELCRACGYASYDTIVLAGSDGAVVLDVAADVDYADLIEGRPFRAFMPEGVPVEVRVRGAGAETTSGEGETKVVRQFEKLLDGPIDRAPDMYPQDVLDAHLLRVEATLIAIARTHAPRWLRDVASFRQTFLRDVGGTFRPFTRGLVGIRAHPTQDRLERFDTDGNVAPLIRVFADEHEADDFAEGMKLYVPGPVVTPAGILQPPLIPDDDDGPAAERKASTR